MPTIDVEQILKRHKRAEDRKEDWRDIYTQAYEYCLPMRNLYDYYETRSPGKQKMQHCFDSTAIAATQSFANRMQSSLFPPYRNWCRLEAGTSPCNRQINCPF